MLAFTHYLSLILATCLLAVSAARADDKVMSQPDQSWISVSGKAVSVSDHGFELDYGEGMVSVEMDDWDWFPEGRQLMPGRQVTVHGKIDDDMYEARSIEAGKVFVKDFNSVFTSPNYTASYLKVISANPSDEELGAEIYAKYTTNPMSDDSGVAITGKIAKISGRKFTITTGANELTVDTRTMGYNPLDDKGYQKIDKGDVVTVRGEMRSGFFTDRALEAQNITKLVQSKRN